MKFNRDIDQLQRHATMWWTEQLKEKNALSNVLPLLLKSQDDFLRILHLSNKSPFHIFKLIESADYPANLFLKHLVVLADYGGEPIQRLGRSFRDIFDRDADGYFISVLWHDKNSTYRFKEMPIKGLNNKKLHIDGVGLRSELELTPLITDMIVILLYGASSSVADQAGLDACIIGSLLGDYPALESFVKQRYIMVSRIIGGATANTLGQLAQTELVEFLQFRLGDDYDIVRNGSVHLKAYKSSNGMPFDVVVTKGSKLVGVEVSFQVTTNSTIERKAGQAADRMNLMHSEEHGIAYVIDGAGNFQRSSAISTICRYSDCTVAYSENEFEVLAKWIISKL